MSVQVARKIFTVEEYHRMGEAGVLSEDDRVELMEGEILMMSPIGSRHIASVNRMVMELSGLLRGRAIVSGQNPVVLTDFSEPEPDIAILKLRNDFYAQALPTAADTLLIIEIGDSSVAYDHDVKLPAYAHSGVPEVWLADLTGELVTSHSDPANGIYRTARVHRRGESITPIQFPDLSIEVTNILA